MWVTTSFSKREPLCLEYVLSPQRDGTAPTVQRWPRIDRLRVEARTRHCETKEGAVTAALNRASRIRLIMMRPLCAGGILLVRWVILRLLGSDLLYYILGHLAYFDGHSDLFA